MSETVTTGPMTLAYTHTPHIYFERLSRGQQFHAGLFDQVCGRIKKLADRLGGNGSGLVDALWKAFAERDPTKQVWVLCEEGQIIGHLYAELQHKNNEWIVFIIQEEVDDSTKLKKATIDLIVADLMSWAKNLSAQHNIPINRVFMETHQPSEGWMRRYGFTEYSTIYQRRIT